MHALYTRESDSPNIEMITTLHTDERFEDHGQPLHIEEGVVRLLETQPEPVPSTDERTDAAKTVQVAAEANAVAARSGGRSPISLS